MRKTMREARNRRATGWGIGLAGSFAAHLCLLGGLFSSGSRAPVAVTPPPEATAVTIAVTPVETPVDPEGAELSDPPLRSDTLPVARPWDARAGERDNPIEVTVAPSDADGRIRLAPAPDQGTAGGQPPDHAYRRDRSTLHARLTDGAAESQPARLRTASRAASLQAIRREPIVGIGDAAQTRTPSRAPAPAVPRAEQVLALGGEPAGASALDARAAPAERTSTATRVAASAIPEHALGPLDAEAGARSFDSEHFGRPADDQTLRAASNERHPGLTDFSRPAALAATPAVEGRGPGSAPGAVARPAAGSAAAALGARDPRATGAEVDERTLDRRYQRYIQEIQQRVDRVRDFPKALALRLEQGETIVRFEVGVDGRLREGPRVVKSSGFEEFDSAALRAVRQAAPFPPMRDTHPQPISLSLRVTFDNPVIR